MEQPSKRVLVSGRVALDYRQPFLEALCRELAGHNVELIACYGRPRRDEHMVDILDALPFGIRRPVRYFGKAFWISGFIPLARTCDLVVMEQANAALHNQLLIARRFLGTRRPRLAFWGHGQDFLSAGRNSWRQRQKRAIATRVDWWFAYTERTRAVLAAWGFPSDRITVVRNATDTAGLRAALSALPADAREQVLRRWFPGAPADGIVGIFCSRLVAYKAVPFLLDAARRLHDLDPRFRLLVIGEGPFKEQVERFCVEHPWCAALGRITGLARAVYFKAADLWLVTGAAGLEIVDALAAGLPLLLVESPRHGPEIAYVRPGENALVLPDDPMAFAAAARDLIARPERLAAMQRTAWQDGSAISVEDMVVNFKQGVLTCLATCS